MRRQFVIIAAATAAIPLSALLAGPAVREPVMPPALMLTAPFAVLQACLAVILPRPSRLQFRDEIRTLGLGAGGRNVPRFSMDEENVQKE
jgi:hypothetical protein